MKPTDLPKLLQQLPESLQYALCVLVEDGARSASRRDFSICAIHGIAMAVESYEPNARPAALTNAFKSLRGMIPSSPGIERI